MFVQPIPLIYMKIDTVVGLGGKPNVKTVQCKATCIGELLAIKAEAGKLPPNMSPLPSIEFQVLTWMLENSEFTYQKGSERDPNRKPS